MNVDELQDRLEGLLDVRPTDPGTFGGIERRARRRRIAARARRIEHAHYCSQSQSR